MQIKLLFNINGRVHLQRGKIVDVLREIRRPGSNKHGILVGWVVDDGGDEVMVRRGNAKRVD